MEEINYMKNTAVIHQACTVAALSLATASPLLAAPSIVPKPTKLTTGAGTFRLTPETVLVADDNIEKAEAQKFADTIAPSLGFKPRVVNKAGRGAAINFNLDWREPTREEGYKLSVTPQGVTITAAKPAGLYYGTQTLRQLLPPQIYARTVQTGINWTMPVVAIEDTPHFQWRGLMMDSGRHFFPVEDVKKFIDTMAVHKFNTFHWHLTEDQGWRLEIKKYPKLTEIGSKRAESPRVGARNQGDGTPYGGFYTQAQAREIVAYAAARHITVVPEIEIPGHAAAAIAAYPELGNTDIANYKPEVIPRWGVHPYTFAPKEETFTFLQNVLREVMDIFPSAYIHIGGDEAPTTQWDKSPFAQEVMKKNNLKNGHQLQSYFNERIEKFLNANGRKLIGWDEILEGGLAPNAAVMSWRGEAGGRAAALQNHPFVMASNSAYYLDYGQSRLPGEPEVIGSYVPLRKTYEFEPAAAIPEEKRYLQLGVQGQLWAEFIKDINKLEYQAYPRACALAETAWTSPHLKNYNDFFERMQTHAQRLSALKVNFRKLDPEVISNIHWKRGDIGNDWMQKEWEVTPLITKAGRYDITFQYTDGEHRLDIAWIELLQNGQVVAREEHEGTTGGRNEGNIYRLTLPSTVPYAKYTLRARVRADGGNDSNGDIFIEAK
jgi:hexosaminidase